jgi:hypothetical protein
MIRRPALSNANSHCNDDQAQRDVTKKLGLKAESTKSEVGERTGLWLLLPRQPPGIAAFVF